MHIIKLKEKNIYKFLAEIMKFKITKTEKKQKH